MNYRVSPPAFIIDPTLFNCSMERTKLSTKQIKHALPNWMFSELVETVAAAVEKKPKKTRRGSRQGKKAKDKEAHRRLSNSSFDEGSSSDESPLSPDLNNKIGNRNRSSSTKECLLSKSIASLPMEMQKCFGEWKRERNDAMANHDDRRQRRIEKVMWQALNNITSRMVINQH